MSAENAGRFLDGQMWGDMPTIHEKRRHCFA
jgi:hypothetical protein